MYCCELVGLLCVYLCCLWVGVYLCCLWVVCDVPSVELRKTHGYELSLPVSIHPCLQVFIAMRPLHTTVHSGVSTQ